MYATSRNRSKSYFCQGASGPLGQIFPYIPVSTLYLLSSSVVAHAVTFRVFMQYKNTNCLKILLDVYPVLG